MNLLLKQGTNQHKRLHDLDSAYDHEALSGNVDEVVTLTAAGLVQSSGEKLSEYVPYTGATGDVDLGVYDLAAYCLTLPVSTGATIGVIYKAANRFIHDFFAAGTEGGNIFIGEAGNFTMAMNTFVYEASWNIGIGKNALDSLTTGYYNVALGGHALDANTTGPGNMAIGLNSLRANIDGIYNTAIGVNSLRNNIDGGYNFGLGCNALYRNQGGHSNVAIGRDAGKGTALCDITGNVLVGAKAGYLLNTGGDYNILIGYQAGDNITTGAENIIIGYNIDALAAAGNYQLNIGDAIFGDLAIGVIEFEKVETLVGNVADAYAASLTLDPGYTGAFTVTRHNYMDIQDVSLAGGAAVTDAAVMRFDATIGTHKALGAAFQTTDSNGDTTDWAGGVYINVAGTLYKMPLIAV